MCAGCVPNGLILHPARKHLIYPLGSTIVIQEIANPSNQEFLQVPRFLGCYRSPQHELHVCTARRTRIELHASKSPEVASILRRDSRLTWDSRSEPLLRVCHAVATDAGPCRRCAAVFADRLSVQADAIIWDLEARTMMHRLRLHKVKVQALSFSCNELYLASLGGPDDNNLVIWDIETGKAVCGSPASNDSAFALSFANNSDFCLITAGNYNLRCYDWPTITATALPLALHHRSAFGLAKL